MAGSVAARPFHSASSTADSPMIPLSAQIWGVRLVAILTIIGLCALAGSGAPATAFALAWGPNGLFLYLFERGLLRLPRVLVPVHAREPVLYRWLGVGFVKHIVATRMWPLVLGFPPPPPLRQRAALLHRIDVATQGAEVCHGATFVLVLFVAWCYLMFGRTTVSAWMLALNVLLNAYPVMLQRANRWRVQQVHRLA